MVTFKPLEVGDLVTPHKSLGSNRGIGIVLSKKLSGHEIHVVRYLVWWFGTRFDRSDFWRHDAAYSELELLS